MTLTVTARQHESATVLDVCGDIDVDTAPGLRQALAEIIDTGRPGSIVIDLAGTDFIDSSALGVLVGATKQLESNRSKLTLVCAKPHLLRVFEITRLNEIIPIVPTVDAAFA